MTQDPGISGKKFRGSLFLFPGIYLQSRSSQSPPPPPRTLDSTSRRNVRLWTRGPHPITQKTSTGSRPHSTPPRPRFPGPGTDERDGHTPSGGHGWASTTSVELWRRGLSPPTTRATTRQRKRRMVYEVTPTPSSTRTSDSPDCLS